MSLFPNNRVAQKFVTHPLSTAGIIVLLILYMTMTFAEFVAPYGFDNGNRANSYQPPSKIRFVQNGSFSLQPFVYPYTFTFNLYFEREYVEDRSEPFYLTLFAKGDRVLLW